ncbi:hypothetical protein ACFOLG_10970 [Vogesella facilis]|uniref:Uncharacterized protein n=1 Tax=Vogesella facilis TaxID=1655232 RepID=A0ABV7RJA2_9NEIS
MKTVEEADRMQGKEKRLRTLPKAEAEAMLAQFPALAHVRENGDSGMARLAISVFDHWLRSSHEWPLLDCSHGPERIARDRKWQAHWQALFDASEVYTVRPRGRWPHKQRLQLKQYRDRAFFLQQCRFNPLLAPRQLVLLPEFDCIYCESWDDTNVAFFHSRDKVQKLVDLAQACGLHCLSFVD